MAQGHDPNYTPQRIESDAFLLQRGATLMDLVEGADGNQLVPAGTSPDVLQRLLCPASEQVAEMRTEMRRELFMNDPAYAPLLKHRDDLQELHTQVGTVDGGYSMGRLAVSEQFRLRDAAEAFLRKRGLWDEDRKRPTRDSDQILAGINAFGKAMEELATREDLRVGATVNVRRTSGVSESGWTIMGATDDGRLTVIKDGVGRKGITLTHLLQENPLPEKTMR